MHPRVYREIDRVCGERNAGGSVLEIGAVPDDSSLLNMKSLGAAKNKIGINLEGPYAYKDYEIIRGNANSMMCFEDETFDTVLCNAVFEHDKYFWKSLTEIHRITKSGGLIVIGAPGYRELAKDRYIQSYGGKNTRGKESWVKALGRALVACELFDFLINSTLTFRVHNEPGDYYRFSLQAFREVLFEGMGDVQVRAIMLPPRIIGSGIKP